LLKAPIKPAPTNAASPPPAGVLRVCLGEGEIEKGRKRELERGRKGEIKRWRGKEGERY
jgi:hypothetical protein